MLFPKKEKKKIQAERLHMGVIDPREGLRHLSMTSRPVHPPSMEKTPILDSRKSNRVLGPDGLPPAPSSSSSFLDRPLPLPLAERNSEIRLYRKKQQFDQRNRVFDCVHLLALGV